MARVLICGAGISGLSAAFWIRRSGHDVLVVEKNHRAGGVIETVEENGFRFEKGPNSFLDDAPDTMELCNELKLENRLIKQPLRSNKRYVFLNGKLNEVPMGPGAFFKTPLLSRRAKAGFFLEGFRGGNRKDEDESCEAFIRRRFGDEIYYNLFTPFVSGVYAADPSKLSIQAVFPKLYELERRHGSLTVGMISSMFRKKKKEGQPKKKRRGKNLCSFLNGMTELTNCLIETLGSSFRCNTAVQKIEREPSGGFSVTLQDSNAYIEKCEAVVVTTPAGTAADLLSGLVPKTSSYLQDIPYNRMAVAGLGYRREDVANECDGFGFLVPRNQGVRFLGSVWNSSLFPNRAPGGFRSFTAFAGGGLDADILNLSDDEIYTIVENDLNVTMGISEKPAYRRLTRWEQAIPQYPIGHVKKIEALQEEMNTVPGLYVTGNFIKGVSVNDCIRNSREIAVRLDHIINN